MSNVRNDFRVAIVGAGNMAREHIRAFQNVPAVAVVGIHSRTRERAENLAKEFSVPGVYGSIEELYAATRADLVVVTVFETAMQEVALSCCQYPWTLLLEKPPGIDVSQAEAIADCAARNRRLALVALNRRFLSSTQHVAGDLAADSGPRFIRVQDQQSLDAARALNHPPIVVAHWMYANSIHLIDYFRNFGRGSVIAVEPIEPWNPEQPGIVLAAVRFSSGDLGLYEGIWRGPGPWAVTVVTPAKRWELRPLEQASLQRAGERKLEPLPSAEWDAQFKPGFRLQAEHAVAAATGAPSQSVTLSEAIESMRLVASIFRMPGA
jgi:predicted dehydrogenase